MSKDTFYFSHDYDARNDEKIIDLMAEMGWEGYGLFWGIIELLYQNDGIMRTQYKRIAYALQTNEESIKSVVESFDLFIIVDDEFWSESVIIRIKERNAKSTKARESALIRWSNANAKRTQSDSNAIKESKVKDSKEKESKINDNILLSELKNSDGLTEIEEITLAFWELFNNNLKKLNITSTDLSKAKYKNWVDPIRLMLDADSRKKEELREIWEFLKTEDLTKDFTWGANIRSTSKLREKFERLLVDARKTTTGGLEGLKQDIFNRNHDG